VLSVTTGFQRQFQAKVLGVNAHILVLKIGDFSDYRRVMDKALHMPGVVAAAPFLFNEMMIARGNRLSGVMVKGLDPRRSGQVLALPEHIVAPRRAPGAAAADLRLLLEPAPNQLAGMIIGAQLAKKLDAKVGDPVRLISPLAGMDVAGWSADADLPRSRDFRITGIFDCGFDEYDKRLIYTHMRELQQFFEQGDTVTGVELKIVDVFRARPMARRLATRLGGSPFRTVDWSELNRNLFAALSIQKVFLEVVVGGFLAVVSCFCVIAALALLVIRKGREIAVLKAMGLSSGGVARVFLACGGIVWLVGSFIGLGAGYLGCLLLRRYGFPLNRDVYLISELPVAMNAVEFLATAGVALLICLIATLYPSYRAARLHPVEGLHGWRR